MSSNMRAKQHKKMPYLIGPPQYVIIYFGEFTSTNALIPAWIAAEKNEKHERHDELSVNKTISMKSFKPLTSMY